LGKAPQQHWANRDQVWLHWPRVRPTGHWNHQLGIQTKQRDSTAHRWKT